MFGFYLDIHLLCAASYYACLSRLNQAEPIFFSSPLSLPLIISLALLIPVSSDICNLSSIPLSYRTCMDAGGLGEIGSLPQGLDSGHQAWWQRPLLAELFHCHSLPSFYKKARAWVYLLSDAIISWLILLFVVTLSPVVIFIKRWIYSIYCWSNKRMIEGPRGIILIECTESSGI